MAFNKDILKIKMKEQRLTRDKLAFALKKHKRTVSRWLSGTNPPKQKDLEAIANVLNCNPQDFDPFFADKGLGQVSIQAHVSVASHNAYEMMRWRYGVTQKQIIELAPILFAIMAGHALKVPDQDNEIWNLCEKNGFTAPIYQGWHNDERAAKQNKCFGLITSNPHHETSRNLFCEAMRRMSLPISNYVAMNWFDAVEPEEVPTSSGYTPDIELLKAISGQNMAVAEAIVKGRIRLSTVLKKTKEGRGSISAEIFAEAIKRTYNQQIEEHRKIGIKKLKAWRAFYAERHPEMAEEYDNLVAQYCQEEGWYPDSYTDDQRTQSWINPYEAESLINSEAFMEYLISEARQKDPFAMFDFSDPLYSRFNELERHRSEVKKQFEEAWS